MRPLVFSAVLTGFVSGLSLWAVRASDPPTPARTERFDNVVREDLFAGFAGDADALARGLKKCDEALAKNPKHAEALVWRGAARV